MAKDNSADIYRDIFATLTTSFSVRAERPDDTPYLFDIYRSCQHEYYDRLGFDGIALLGEAMVRDQFDLRERAYRGAHPAAMRVIAEETGGGPVGRFIVDWSAEDGAHGVDLAVHPAHRRGGAGLHLLRAWVATADRQDRAASLEVMPDNPARAIYQRLGFVAEDWERMPVRMRRARRTP